MIYPFMTLSDDTEITHSAMQKDGTVTVYIETPDAEDGFHHASCILPEQRWQDISGYTEAQLAYLKDLVRSTAHLMLTAAAR